MTAQITINLDATVGIQLELPDSKLKAFIIDNEIDIWQYIDVSISPRLAEDFKNVKVVGVDITVEQPDISNYESIYKNDGTELEFDGYKLTAT